MRIQNLPSALASPSQYPCRMEGPEIEYTPQLMFAYNPKRKGRVGVLDMVVSTLDVLRGPASHPEHAGTKGLKCASI